MNEIDSLGQDARNFAQQHPKDVKEGESKAEGMLGQRIGQKPADDVVQGGTDLLENGTGGGNRKPGP